MVPMLAITLVARHADAVIRDAEGARLLVDANRDPQLGIGLVEGRVGERFEAQLVRCVRAVGDQFPEENLLVAVQGVDHQRKQLLHLGLETERLPGGGLNHAVLPVSSSQPLHWG
jgi:hypothetical protein